MPRQIKINQKMGLKNLDFLQEDQTGATIFRVDEIPSVITSGINQFKIKGNNSYLQSSAAIKIEVLDGIGNPIFCEPIQYLEPGTGNRIVTVVVYGHEASGLGSISLVAIATRRLNGNVISGYWSGKYNTIFTTNVQIRPTKTNVTECLFLKAPRMGITEITRNYVKPATGSYDGTVTTSGSVAYTPNNITQQQSAQFAQNNPYDGILSISPQDSWEGEDDNQSANYNADLGTGAFNTDMIGGQITVTFNDDWLVNETTTAGWTTTQTLIGNSSLTKTFTITQVLGYYQLGVQGFFNVDISQTQNHTDGTYFEQNILNFTPDFISSSPATASFQRNFEFESTTTQTEAFAKVELADIEPVVGDVRSIRCYVKPQGFQTWDLVDEKTLEANELLTVTDGLGLEEHIGNFYKDEIRNKYWAENGTHTGVASSALFFTSSLNHGDGIVLSGSRLPNTTPPAFISLETKKQDESVGQGVGTMTIGSGISNMQISLHANTPDAFTVGLGKFNTQFEISENGATSLSGPTGKLKVFANNEYVISFRATSKGGPAAWTANPLIEVYLTGSAVGGVSGKSILVDKLSNSGSATFKHFSSDPSNQADATVYSTWGDSMVTPIVPSDLTAQTLNQGFSSGFTNGVQAPNIDGMVVDKAHLAYYFTPNLDGDWGLQFKVLQGDWHLADISLKGIQQTGFTPNHTVFDLKLPTYQYNNVVDFRFDFYDNLNRPVLSLITSSFGFAGGTTAITHPSSSMDSGATLTMSGSTLNAQGFEFENFEDENI